MRKFTFLRSTVLVGLMASSSLFAQKSFIQKESTSSGVISFAKLGPDQSEPLSRSEDLLNQVLDLKDHDKFKLIKTEKDELGYVHQRYEQYYQDIKVAFAEYFVHGKNEKIETINGAFKRIASVPTVPSLSEATALEQALRFVGAESYKWEITGEEKFLRETENDPRATYYPKGELVIVESPLKEDNIYHLAYKFDIYAHEPISRAYVYVDAITGEIVYNDAIIKHANSPGTAATRYSGSQSITTDSNSSKYRLRETGRGNGIQTFNLKNKTSYSSAVDFTDVDNNWTTAEFDNTKFDNAALDAHWGAEKTYDYWKNIHGRNSYDNKGTVLKSYVHYSTSYENAFWDGSKMTYGDGASRFKPLTSLDVCGHEIGHGVCSATANLTYSGESGAMNEGLSDIWGACIEAYSSSAKQPFLIGEDIIKGSYTCLRSMSNPTGVGPLSKQPNYYKGINWYTGSSDNGGVHTNSGVLNFWFYLLSEGGSGTSAAGVYCVSSIGIIKAAKITFRAESVYLTSSSKYANMRTATIAAATDLYGANSPEVIQVTNAWFAVGIGAASPSGICNSIAGIQPDPAQAIQAYPNPANAYIEIADQAASIGASGKASGEFQVILYNKFSQVKKTGTTFEGKLKIDTSELTDGTYYLHLIQGDKSIMKSVIIQH